MKQYTSLSLALLLSIPVFGMEKTLQPTAIHDTSGSEQASESFSAQHAAGFHQFVAEELVKVPVIEATPETILQILAERTAYHDAQKPEKSKSITISAITELSRRAADEAAAARASAPAKDMEDNALALTQAAELHQLAEARAQEIFAQHGKESLTLAKQLDSAIDLPKTNSEKFLDYITSQPTNGYESDTEKGLSQENIQLYRFSKYVASTKKILLAAHPLLIAWLNDTEKDKPSEKLPEYATQLDAHINRIEVWQTQIGLTTCKKLTGYDTLKTLLAEMKKGFGKFATDENSEKADKFEHNISHPAIQFLMVAERLEKLLE